MNIWYYVLKPFSMLLLWLYETFGSYALSLVLFTIIIRVIMFPLSLKGKRSMMQMNALSASMQQLQKQYGKDRERYNQEITELYQREGVSPTGGCLWSFLPIPVLIGLYAIVRRPLYYMMGIGDEGIQAVARALNWEGFTSAGYNEIILTNMLNKGSNFETAKNALGGMADRLSTIDFSFLGLDLSQTPSWKVWEGPFDWPTLGIAVIPIVVAVLSFFSSKVSMRTNQMNQKKGGGDNPSEKASQRMMVMMPLMYVWFGYVMPAGMSVYMCATSVVMMVQEVVSARLLRQQFEELEARRIAREKEEKETERRERDERFAQREREAEESRRRGGRKKPAPPKEKKDSANEAGRVGIRSYARGREYDPDRYGGVTPYRDPNLPGGHAPDAVEFEEPSQPVQSSAAGAPLDEGDGQNENNQ